MKLRLFAALFIWLNLTSYDLASQITLPVKLKDGFGPFPPKLVAYSGISDKNDTLPSTFTLEGIPKALTEVRIGFLGFVVGPTLDRQKLHDKTQLSRSEEGNEVSNLNQQNSFGRLAFAYGKTPEGSYLVKFDKNLDGNLANEQEYSIGEMKEGYNIEALEKDTVKLPILHFKTDKVVKSLISFVFKVNKDGNLFYSIAMHGTANIYNVDIAVNFRPSADNRYLITQLLTRERDSIENMASVEKGHLFRVKNNIFRYTGMNLFEESLYLERVPLRRAISFSTPPGFSAKEITTGETISLQDFQGKFVYIDFWGSWCKPCIAEMPNLREAISELKHENIEFLGVAEDTKRAAQKAIQKFKITWPQVLSGRKNSLADAFNVTSFPTTLLLAPDGRIIAENIRGESLSKQLLEEIQRYKLLQEMN